MIGVLRQRNFTLLWIGGFVSMLGDWMLYTALPIYVYQLTGSALATSLTFIAEVLPGVLFGSLAGVFVDRWDRKRVMMISNLLLAASVLPLLFVRSADMVWLVYVAAFVQTTINQFFGPAEHAFLPRVVGDDQLVAANALNALNDNIARLVGPPLGGAIAVLFSLRGITIIDAATYVFAAAMIALVTTKGNAAAPLPSATPTTTAWATFWQQFRDGIVLIVRKRVLVVTLVMFAISRIGEGVFAVMFILWISGVLGGGALELGWFFGAQAIGGVIGGLFVGRAGQALGMARLLWTSTILFGLLDLTLFNYPRFSNELWIGLALMALVGVPSVGFGTGLTTLWQTAVEDEYRGRVFGAFRTIGALFFVTSTSLTGVWGQAIGPITMLNIQGGAYVVAGLFALIMLRASTHNKFHQMRAEQADEPTSTC